MMEFYNSIDVYVTLMAQNGAHGVGRTILESMSCGLPVVATNIASTAKVMPKRWLIFEKNVDAIVKRANRKLEVLDNDRELLAEVGRTNREFIIKNYSWKVIGREWDRLFEEVAALH